MRKAKWNQIEKLISLSVIPLVPELEQLQAGVNSRAELYYRFLYLLVSEFEPLVSIEIGVEIGLGSAHMCAAAAEYGGLVIGIDHNASSDADKINARYGNHLYVIDDSIAAFERVSKNLRGKVGLVYQDSSHHYEASRKEFELYSTLLADNAIWICDDITPSFHDPNIDPPGMGMVQYFEGLPGDKRLYADVLHYGSTQGIVLL